MVASATIFFNTVTKKFRWLQAVWSLFVVFCHRSPDLTSKLCWICKCFFYRKEKMDAIWISFNHPFGKLILHSSFD